MDINSDDSYENLRSKKEKKDPFLLNLEKTAMSGSNLPWERLRFC